MTVTTNPTAPSAPPVRRLGGGRVTAIVIGAVLAFLGANFLIGGGLALGVEGRQDADGYYTTRVGRFATGTYAIAAPTLDATGTGPDALYQQGLLGRIRLEAEPTGDRPLFVGIGPADRVAAYLAGVNHDAVSELDVGLFGVQYDTHAGGAPAGPPTAQTFWVASSTGTGARDLTWRIASGDWAAVVMNADGSAGVAADVRAGATLPVVHTVAVASFVTGGVLILIGAVTILLAARRRRAG